MKLPRDVSGRRLAQALAAFGYLPTRQTGSHLRLTTREMGEHHVTVPIQKALPTGTLRAIIKDIAQHCHLAPDEVVRRLLPGL